MHQGYLDKTFSPERQSRRDTQNRNQAAVVREPEVPVVGYIHSQTAAAHNTSPFQQKTPKSAPKFKDEPTADYQTFSKQQTPKPQILSDSDNEFYRQQALIN